MKKVYQFEIWNINLNPTKGSEQSGMRPALIIETNATQNQGNTTIVIPLTSKIDPVFTFDVLLEPNTKNGLIQKSKLKIRQVRVIDKTRLFKNIGRIDDPHTQKKILETLKMVFDCEQLFV